jgi:hypothetical protein
MASEPISALTQTYSASANNIVPIVFNGVTQSISISSLVSSASAALYGEPYFSNTSWWLLPKGTYNPSNMAQNVLYAVPFIVSQPSTFMAMGIHLTTSAASGVVTGAIYGSTTGNMPGNLISSTTLTYPITAIGGLSASFTSPLYFTPGVYWLATVSQNSVTVTVDMIQTVAYYGLPFTSVVNTSCVGYGMNGVSGALPTTYTINSSLGLVPRMWMKLQ